MTELDELFTRLAERSAGETSQRLAEVARRAGALAARQHRQRAVSRAAVLMVATVLGTVAVAGPRTHHTVDAGSGPGSTTAGTAPRGTGVIGTAPPGTRPTTASGRPLPPDLLPSPEHVVSVRALGMAVELPGQPLQLCFSARLDRPEGPYCNGMRLAGRLDGLPPLEPTGSHDGVRSTGMVTVTARYDGSSLTSTAPIVPGIDPAADRDYPIYSSCAPPPGGWAPARRGSPAAAEALARSLPGYEDSRLMGPLGPSPLDAPATRDVGPDGSLLLVTFLDHAAENETRLRAAYDGPLCVLTDNRTPSERAGSAAPPRTGDVINDLRSVRGLSMASARDGHIVAPIVYGDQRIAAWLAGNHPDRPFELVPYLHPVG